MTTTGIMDSLLINETHHLFKWHDGRDECILGVSAEFDNNRYACQCSVTTKDVYDAHKRQEIKNDLRFQLLESMDKECRRRIIRMDATPPPPVIVRWTGTKSHVRILQNDEDIPRVLAARMVNDMNMPPLKNNTPVENINWRVEGF